MLGPILHPVYCVICRVLHKTPEKTTRKQFSVLCRVFNNDYSTYTNILSLYTQIETPIHLLIYAFIQWANTLAVAQCINLYRCRSGAIVDIYICPLALLLICQGQGSEANLGRIPIYCRANTDEQPTTPLINLDWPGSERENLITQGHPHRHR